MFFLFMGLVAISSLISLFNWRNGLFATIAIVVIQDPIRKITPGAPGTISLAPGIILIAIVLGLMLAQQSWWLKFKQTFPKVKNQLYLLFFALLPAAVISATYGPGSWILTVFGAFSYGIIFLSIIIGFYFPRTESDIRRLMAVYALLTAPMLSGAFIQYLNLMSGSLLIGTEALNFEWIRYSDGYVVDLIAGFYRSPDIMGWHAATTAIFSFNLAISARSRSRRLFWLVICAVGITALFFCGRRKMFYMLPIFAVSLLWMFWQSGRQSRVLSLVTIMAIPLVTVIAFGNWLGPDATFVNYYTDQATNTYSQLENHGIRALFTTVRQSGFFGSGLGVAAPGSHHFQVARPRVWQESGPSRVMVELGIIGFVAMIAVILSLMKTAWAQVKQHIRMRSPLGYYTAGMFAFFFANVSSLVVSGQILADPFISSFLGISIGLVLSAARFPMPILSPPPYLLSTGYPQTYSQIIKPTFPAEPFK